MLIFAKITNLCELAKMMTQNKNYSLKEMSAMAGRLAGPAILSNVTVPLLGLSDTFITGHLGAERFIAAIAVGTMMVNAIYWLCGFLRMGTTGLTAEAFGASDADRRKRILTVSLLLAVAIGLLMIILSPLLEHLMLSLIDPPPATAELAGEYFIISVWAAPAILSTMAVSGWMVGSQNTVFPMVTAISVNVINIALSMILVFGFDLGFKGVAYGTLCANWIGLLISFILAKRLVEGGKLLILEKRLMKNIGLRRFFSVNGNLFVRSACLMSVSFALTGFAGRMGDNVLAVNAVLMQFFMFFSYFMDGFAFAGEALCGRFMGEGNIDGFRLAVKALLIWSGIVTVSFTLVYSLFTPAIAGLLTNVGTVVAGITSLRWVACILPAVSVAAFMFDGIYIGLTDTARMMIATVCGAALFFALHYLFAGFGASSPIFAGAGGLWTAFLGFLFVRGSVLGLTLKSTVKKRFITMYMPK